MTRENRSVDRAITLIEALARQDSMSLADLHAETGLPKSTIRRLLGTLVRRRIARRSIADERYRINVVLPDISPETIPRGLSLIADAALPHALALTRSVGWPSDLHVRDGIAMRIIDSTRAFSPHRLYRGQINRRLNAFGAASGVACLAAGAPSTADALHRATYGDPVWGLARFGMTRGTYDRVLDRARTDGYGIRLATYLGETRVDDSLAAIAVPINHQRDVIGALTLLWPRAFATPAAFAGEHLSDLRRTVGLIEASLAELE